jgi:hypothetical protein
VGSAISVGECKLLGEALLVTVIDRDDTRQLLGGQGAYSIPLRACALSAEPATLRLKRSHRNNPERVAARGYNREVYPAGLRVDQVVRDGAELFLVRAAHRLAGQLAEGEILGHFADWFDRLHVPCGGGLLSSSDRAEPNGRDRQGGDQWDVIRFHGS